LAVLRNRHAREITMADLPRIGTPMFLLQTEDTSYRSRLEAVDGDTISVTAPLETEGLTAPRPGQVIEVFWAQPRARVILPCRLVRIADTAPYQWILEPIGEPRRSNRREFVRGGGGPAVGLGAEEEQLKGRLLDISEGGLRCWVPEAGGVKVGDRLSASLRLRTGSLEQEGAVHTVSPAFDEPGHHLILTFHSDEATAQLIRQHVFAWELTERGRDA
jgi:c-di-GMP-binding flagellar brake protein YcgR